MHLRAAFKAGRWDEVMIGVLTAHARRQASRQGASSSNASVGRGPKTWTCPNRSSNRENRQRRLPPFLPMRPRIVIMSISAML